MYPKVKNSKELRPVWRKEGLSGPALRPVRLGGQSCQAPQPESQGEEIRWGPESAREHLKAII